jgi:hypothetical protein
MTSDYFSKFKTMTSAMNNIAQAIINTNNQVWKLTKIIESMRKLRLEGSNFLKKLNGS